MRSVPGAALTAPIHQLAAYTPEKRTGSALQTVLADARKLAAHRIEGV